MITEPPQPPQKQILPVGDVGDRVGLRQPVADAEPQRDARAPGRRRSPARGRSGRSSPATAAGRRPPRRRARSPTRSGRPSGRCRGRWRRRCRPAASRACWPPSAATGGPVKVLTTGLSRPRAARSNGSGGGGITSAIRPQSLSAAPIWKSAPSGPAISLGHELLQRCAGDPAEHLADQVAEVQRVIAGRGARRPPRRLGREPGGGLLPVVQILGDGGLVQAGHPGGVRQQVPDQHVLLAVGGELRPVRRDRGVHVQLAALDQHQRGQAGDGLGGGPDVGDGVARPTAACAPRPGSRPRCPPRSRRPGPPRSTRRSLRPSRRSARGRRAPARTGHRRCRGCQPSVVLLAAGMGGFRSVWPVRPAAQRSVTAAAWSPVAGPVVAEDPRRVRPVPRAPPHLGAAGLAARHLEMAAAGLPGGRAVTRFPGDGHGARQPRVPGAAGHGKARVAPARLFNLTHSPYSNIVSTSSVLTFPVIAS